MITRLITWLSDQINSLILTVSGVFTGMIFGQVKETVEIIPFPIEHFITTILQWTSFSVAIVAGIWTVYIGCRKLRKDKNKT